MRCLKRAPYISYLNFWGSNSAEGGTYPQADMDPGGSSGGFLRGFKRFIARKGIPDVVIHHNFKTFTSVVVKKFMLMQGIRQNFILPLAPWWGGFYERLVRTVKVCLNKTLGKSFVTFEELQTILCEIEMVINNRPLAYVSDDDMDEALAPYQQMHGRDICQRILCLP